MQVKITDLPRFIESGQGRIARLSAILRRHGVRSRNALLLCDDNTASLGAEAIMASLSTDRTGVHEHRVRNSDEEGVLNAARQMEGMGCDLAIGFGGGKVLDVAKRAAAQKNAHFISVPTTLSNDGIASPVAVIKDESNIPISHITRPPVGVIIDISIIRKAPLRHLMAGVGDLISNLSAIFDARLALEESKEESDSAALALAEAGARHLLDSDCEDVSDPAFLEELAHGLVKSGLAMCLSGTSRPASGSEHKISHSIDHLFPPCKGLHGEQVGISTLFTMALQENALLDRVQRFYARIGFPCTLGHLNLTADEFVRAVGNASQIRPQRYTILDHARPTEARMKAIIRSLSL